MQTKLLVILAAAFSFLPFQPIAQAQAQELIQSQSKLPPGYYVYMGRQVGSSPPESVVIKNDGSFRWEDTFGISQSIKNRKTGTIEHVQNQVSKGNNLQVTQAVKGESESCSYPFVKWKPILLPTGALVQLDTTIEPVTPGMLAPAAIGGNAIMRYKLHVSLHGKDYVPPIQIRLLDRNGFSMTSFTIPDNAFYNTGASDLEAQGTTSVTADGYKSATEYSVLLI